MIFERINKNIAKDIYTAGFKITPSEYSKRALIASIVLSIVLTLTISILLNKPLMTALILPVLLPLFIVLMAFIPRIVISFRSSDMSVELPYFLTYLSTLSIVLSPLKVFERISKVPDYIFKELKYEAKRFVTEVWVYNKDPLDALLEIASTTPLDDFRNVLEGYVTSVKTGSNPTVYLMKQAEIYIRKKVAEIRAQVENMISLMEAFVSIAIFTVVTLFSLSVSSEALPSLAGQMLSTLRVPPALVTISYTLPLLLSFMFLIMAKTMQPRAPIGEYRQYKPIVAFHIIGLVVILMLLSFVKIKIPFPQWTYKPLVITSILLVVSIFSSIVDSKYSRFYNSLRNGIRNFIKDLTELRRAGVAPEKAIELLSSRNYGVFSKYVKLLDYHIKTFRSLKNYIQSFAKEVRDWFPIQLMFTLIDTLDVGGGTKEVFEKYSNYVDSLFVIEAERKARIKVLKFMPFITAIIQFFTIMSVIYIFDVLIKGLGRGSLMDRIGPTVFSFLSVTNYVYGLIAGMLSEEKLSGGFKYSALLMAITIVFIIAGETFVRSFFSIIGGTP